MVPLALTPAVPTSHCGMDFDLQGTSYGTPRGTGQDDLAPGSLERFTEMWFWKEEDGQMKLDSYRLLSSHIANNQVRRKGHISRLRMHGRGLRFPAPSWGSAVPPCLERDCSSR